MNQPLHDFSEHQLSLVPFYKGWDVYQQRLVAAIAPLTSEQLALRSSPQNWSVGMLVTHIVSARAWWLVPHADGRGGGRCRSCSPRIMG